MRRATLFCSWLRYYKHKFQSTLSVRRATLQEIFISTQQLIFQSTLSVRRATRRRDTMIYRDGNFNPRSPWGERRIILCFSSAIWQYFNPRSPWGERRARRRDTVTDGHFNPRSPWGERQACRLRGAGNTQHFNPRSPWGERQCGRARCVSCIQFQSTLSVRRATVSHRYYARHARFQSTLSVRRATEYIKNDVLVLKISIHALREESDRLLF